MSGQQIGTVVGGIIGAYFGMPTLGMAIGGFIGGLVDPTKINGPHTGDAAQQSSQDGSPIAWVQGQAWASGTIVQASKVREKKVKDSGKGGPVVSHYENHQDFAILICESSQLRDSYVASILMVEQDGKIVYDVRDSSQIKSDSSKWAANVDFMFGDENQMPHPTLEAISGVGNTCAYRGSCVAVFKDFNISNSGNRIPTFRFLVSGAPYFLLPAQSSWRWKNVPLTDPTNYYDPAYDDSSWKVGGAPFGNIDNVPASGTGAHAFNSLLSATIGTKVPLDTRTVIRKRVYLGALPPSGFTMTGWLDNTFTMYVNGVFTAATGSSSSGPISLSIPSTNFVVGSNLIVVYCDDDPYIGPNPFDVSYFDFFLQQVGTIEEQSVGIAQIVSRICNRGGLTDNDLDLSLIENASTFGYGVNKQMTAVDALGPLLQSYFIYGSEFDQKINFDYFGRDVVMTVSDADLLEGNDANKSAITQTKRSQETEFPKTFIGTYYDPDQNYRVVTVRRARSSTSVNAIGEQTFDMPVAINSTDAIRAVDKAMKAAYAQLEGTLEFSVPFGESDAFLTVCAGESIGFRGKRYIVDQATISNGYVHWQMTYDRQSAYQSQVQAAAGLAPSVPSTPFSGPTLLYAMNLPALRPQDSQGIYLVASSTTGSPNWKGCQLDVSLDGQTTWVPVAQMIQVATMGTLTAAMTTGQPIKVTVNGELDSITSAQLAAGQNAAAIITSADIAEIVQFQTATNTSGNNYDLTSYTRGNLGTPTPTHATGDRFAMLDSAYFYPLDVSFTGQTIYFRATGFGETVGSGSTIVALVYKPNTDVVINGGVVTT